MVKQRAETTEDSEPCCGDFLISPCISLRLRFRLGQVLEKTVVVRTSAEGYEDNICSAVSSVHVLELGIAYGHGALIQVY